MINNIYEEDLETNSVSIPGFEIITDDGTYYNLKHIGGCARRTGERRQSLVLPTVKLSVHLVPCFAYAGKVP